MLLIVIFFITNRVLPTGLEKPGGFFKKPGPVRFFMGFSPKCGPGDGFFAKNPGFLGFFKKVLFKKEKKIKLIE